MNDILKHLQPEEQYRFLVNLLAPTFTEDKVRFAVVIQNIMDEVNKN
jgi:hypothetical protein